MFQGIGIQLLPLPNYASLTLVQVLFQRVLPTKNTETKKSLHTYLHLKFSVGESLPKIQVVEILISKLPDSSGFVEMGF